MGAFQSPSVLRQSGCQGVASPPVKREAGVKYVQERRRVECTIFLVVHTLLSLYAARRSLKNTDIPASSPGFDSSSSVEQLQTSRFRFCLCPEEAKYKVIPKRASCKC